MTDLLLWEKRLKPYYNSELRFIGEIPLTFSDVEDMAGEVKRLIENYGIGIVSSFLADELPFSLITLMSSFAAYNTQQNYWQAFADLIGAEKNSLFNQGWHHNFVKLARKQGLKVFDFEDGANPYVTSIRFQGGIPTYSLPDYFERMVLPAVLRVGLREIQPKEALDYLLKHAYFVDSPVLNFLENSGQLGVEFFTASCKLVKHTIDHHGEILDADDVDLPSYVVAEFEKFWEHREDEKQHWSKPVLLAAPYSEESPVLLLLPDQVINLEISGTEIFWRVEWNEQNMAVTIPCKVFSNRQNVLAKVSLPYTITETPKRISVSILSVDENGIENELRCWNLPMLPTGDCAPLVAFDHDRRILPFNLAIPAEPMYLLMPKDATLDIVGDAQCTEECTELESAWQGWKMQVWDLTKAWSVQVLLEGAPAGRVIPVQGIIAQPELTGGHLFQYQDISDLPLYTTEAPSLKVPASSLYGSQAGLSGWQIRIYSVMDALPVVDTSFRLSQYQNDVKVENDRVVFPLNKILGENPVGTYKVVVHGPRDIHSDFNFRIWPKLMIFEHEMRLTKPDNTSRPTSFILHLQENARCVPQPGAVQVSVIRSSTGWKVSVPPESTRVNLDLIVQIDNSRVVRVPVMIPLPKLRWGLATELSQGSLDLNQAIITRSIDKLLQSGSSALHVEMYGLGNLLHSISLRLVEMGVDEKVIQEDKFTRTDFTRDWLRCGLSQFRDSIKDVSSLAQFELAYWPAGKTEEPVRIPLLELSRELEINQVNLEPIDETTWKLIWDEAHPLKNRRAMIIAAWQPWQKPWEYKIPDNARGELVIEGTSIPPSRYLIYFYIMPAWNAPRMTPPENIKPLKIDLISPEERIETISNETGNDNEKFASMIEKASVYDSLCEPLKSGEMLSCAAKYLIHLTNLDLLMGTLKWIHLKEVNPPAVKSFFLKAMFNFQVVSTVLNKYKLSDPVVVEFMQYTGKVKDNIPADSAKLILKRVDEPIAIYNSLHSLMKRKDSELIPIVLKRIENERLSTRDALDLLALDPLWSIQKIAEENQNQYADMLIAGLLPKIAQSAVMTEDSRVSDWMIRAFPYEKDGQLILSYIRHLFFENFPLVYQILFNCLSDNLILDNDVMEILSMDPKTSIETIEKLPAHKQYQIWIDKLAERFPTAAGIIKPGSRLKTPFGLVMIDTIETNKDIPVTSIRFNCVGYRVNAVAGEGGDRFRLIIDFEEMKISIPETIEAWKCGICGLIHPKSRTIMGHRHVTTSLSKITLPLNITRDDVTLK
jgi:hypothetical protein